MDGVKLEMSPLAPRPGDLLNDGKTTGVYHRPRLRCHRCDKLVDGTIGVCRECAESPDDGLKHEVERLLKAVRKWHELDDAVVVDPVALIAAINAIRVADTALREAEAK